MVTLLEQPRSGEDLIDNLQACVAEQVVGEVDGSVNVNLPLPLPRGRAKAVYDPYNERIKVYGLTASDLSGLEHAGGEEEVASKVTAYAPAGQPGSWQALGFRHEGCIRGYFEDGTDAHLWAAYTEQDRQLDTRRDEHDAGVRIARAKPALDDPTLPQGYTCHEGQTAHAGEIAALLQQTFADYPTPIREEVVAGQIRRHTNHFRLVRDGAGEVAAVASAEMDHRCRSAEMTDCATRTDQRGRGLMAHLLWRLEQDVAQAFSITDLYTLARADEVGMNCVFSKLGYVYSGRLVNNCRMPNGWESMNVWCKNSTRS